MQALKLTELDNEQRKRMAREHAALFPTRLAFARWSSNHEARPLHVDHAPLRAAWLAQAQRAFQAWLDNGGFVQHDEVQARRDSDGPGAEMWEI